MTARRLILLLAMVTFLSPTLLNITIALGVLAVPGYVRLARANTLTVASREFVIASQTLGASTGRILFRNLLPNVVPPLIAYSFIVMSFLIVAEASLSYLGLGIQRPNPTWGNLIAQGQTFLETNPSLVLIPSLALFLTVMSANFSRCEASSPTSPHRRAQCVLSTGLTSPWRVGRW